MIFEHEIPSGSRLYFGKSAKIKREVEQRAAEALSSLGFEEIVTPLFSYHQHDSFDVKTPLIRLNDETNHEVTLRADSTADVVRIVTKRLGRSLESKKWFYIQPTVTFPTMEQYQVGAEIIDGTFTGVAKTTVALLETLEETPLMQISNIQIPHLLNEKYGVSLEVLKSMHVEAIVQTDLPWIAQLVQVHTAEDLEDLSAFPADIRAELTKIKDAVSEIEYPHVVISPLFYSKMRYYDSLTLRMFEGNTLFATGGTYSIEGVEAAGVALYTDACISSKINRVVQ